MTLTFRSILKRRRSATCLMRRASQGLLVLCAAFICSSAAASASPTLTIKVTAIPIPGVPGTGDVLGAGAAMRGEAVVSGSEYGGFPPPLTGFTIFAPAGMTQHPQGFAACAQGVLEKSGPEGCPKRSIAGPPGSATGVVSFGGERVPETASVQTFFAPGGALEDFVDGKTPALFEIVATAHLSGASRPFGLEFTGDVPLIETVPGAPDASFEKGTLLVGAAYRQGKKTISYLTLPKACTAADGMQVKAQLSFLGGATAEASYKMPCPRK